MSFCDRLVLKLYALVALIGSFFLLAFYFHFIDSYDFVEYMSHIPCACENSIQLFVGIVLFLMALSLFNLSRSSFKRKKRVSFKTEKGIVSIELSAIENYIFKVLDEFSQVVHSKNRVLMKGKSLFLLSKLHLKDNNNLKNFTSLFQEEVEKQLKNIIGFSVPFIIQVDIIKILHVSSNDVPSSLHKSLNH